jgi:hypothetical protein
MQEIHRAARQDNACDEYQPEHRVDRGAPEFGGVMKHDDANQECGNNDAFLFPH